MSSAGVRRPGTGRQARDEPAYPWTFPILGGGMLVIAALGGVNLVVTIVATALEVLFFAYFVRHLAFAAVAIRTAPNDLSAPLIDSGFRPRVTVLVACHNEESVVTLLVDRLLALDYPAERLQILVVDDGSTDRTPELLDSLAASHATLEVLHRPPGSPGAKSGALNEGLTRSTGEILVVFDADHQPRPDVVLRLVRHFEDPNVAAAQGRCVINNPSDSPLAHLVAIDYMAGYLVNEYGRQGLFELPAYGGANCAVRASSLRALGGWNPSSVTEDTDLTLRLKLGGAKVRYDVTAVDEEEGVVVLSRFWRQRYRWARGHQQVWRDYWRSVLRSANLTFAEKVETIMFLAGFHIPAACSLGVVVLGLWSVHLATPASTLDTPILWTLLFIGPLLEMAGGLLVARASRREVFMLALFLPLFFVSVALCTKAWVDGVAGRGYTWVKTKRSADGMPGEVQAA